MLGGAPSVGGASGLMLREGMTFPAFVQSTLIPDRPGLVSGFSLLPGWGQAVLGALLLKTE